MPPEPPDGGSGDPALLLDMKLAAEDAVRFIAGLDESAFLASDLHQSAVIRKLEVVGEAAAIDLDPGNARSAGGPPGTGGTLMRWGSPPMG